MNELIISKGNAESDDFKSFLETHENEISEIFPHFSEDDAYYGTIYLLKMDDKIIGIFIYQSKGEELHVDVDYVISSYRDIGIGADFFSQKIEEFKKLGFSIVVALTSNKKHIDYIKKCNFIQSSKHPDRYELNLK